MDHVLRRVLEATAEGIWVCDGGKNPWREVLLLAAVVLVDGNGTSWRRVLPALADREFGWCFLAAIRQDCQQEGASVRRIGPWEMSDAEDVGSLKCSVR